MKTRAVLVSAIILILLSAIAVIGQGEEQKTSPRRISRGVVNGVAISLPKPVYPAAALAVNAGGAVNVSVLIGTDGNVIEANAVSGHPLLRQASVEAARRSKFTPTLLEGQPVEVTGIIVYNFQGGRKPLDALKLGFAVEYVKVTSKEPGNEALYKINRNIPDDWKQESGQVRGLLVYFQVLDAVENGKTKANIITQRPGTEGILTLEGESNTSQPQSSTGGGAGTFRIGTSADKVSVENPAETAAELDQALQIRLGSGNTDIWRYETGKAIAAVLANLDNPGILGGAIAQIKIQKGTAPISLPPGLGASLEKIVSLYENPGLDEETKRESIAAECLLLGT